MSKTNLKEEVGFGLENLNKVYESINYIFESDGDKLLKVPALTYECFGYYNAIEHLILRITKYLKITVPGGAFSHKETLKNFFQLVENMNIESDQSTLNAVLELMAFRHVATKIYGFLIDEEKLEVIVGQIKNEHQNISKLLNRVLEAVIDQ
ncbi:MAG: hypothetical protein D3923_07440 [Candidatus Electrothrix sp. AR3]|nr:hypothetical protein [Candidatus Electrothrix sp. AR3]